MAVTNKPLAGIIVDSTSAFSAMRHQLSELRNDNVWLISAFLKASALQTLLEGLHDSNHVAILCRWAAVDLISGASDLESFELAQSFGWQFFIRKDLHAKAYRIGHKAIFMGSGNLTNMGFALNQPGNLETMVSIEASQENIRSLERIFDYSLEIDNELFTQLKNWINSLPNDRTLNEIMLQNKYPLDLAWYKKFQKYKPSCIAVSECFFTNGNWLDSPARENTTDLSEEELHDLSLLIYCDSNNIFKLTQKELSAYIKQTRLIKWLIDTVSGEPGKEIYFGALTAAFHTTLLDDPKP